MVMIEISKAISVPFCREDHKSLSVTQYLGYGSGTNIVDTNGDNTLIGMGRTMHQFVELVKWNTRLPRSTSKSR
jgi:hypothetical protein